MGVVLLILIGALSGFAMLAYRQAHERASWVRYRVRIAHGTNIPRVEAQFLGLCHQAGGGEIWAVREGHSYALVVALPHAWGDRFEHMITRYAPGSHLAPVRQLMSPPAPTWSMIIPGAATAPLWPCGVDASLVMIAITKNGHGAIFAADSAWPTSDMAAPGWRRRNVPLPLWLRRYGLSIVRGLLVVPTMTRTQPLGGLFPDPALVPGAALPMLPAHPTKIRERSGGVLRLGFAQDGSQPSLPLGNNQAIEIVGGSEERRPVLIQSLRGILQAHASLVAFLQPATVDGLLAQADQLRRRMRVVDYRSMATTATLDLATLLNDDQMVSLLDALMLFDPLDPVRRLIRPALRHWRNDPAPQQIGLLLARLLDPPPEVSALAQDEDGGESFFNWRTYGARWQMCLQPYLSRKLLGLLTAPGEQLAPLLEAGGALIVVQPSDPKQCRALHLILEAIIKALPVVNRPIVVVSEYEQGTDRLAIQPHAALWTSSTWGSDPAWRMATGGMRGKTLPANVRNLVGHPLALAILKKRWFLCGPDADEYAVMLPPGAAAPAPQVFQTPTATLPIATTAVIQAENTHLKMDDRAAAVQTVLAALRRIGSLHGAIGTIEYVIPHAVKRRPVESIEGMTQPEQTVEVALRNVSPAMEEHLPAYLADGATANMDGQWLMTDTTTRFLAINVRTTHVPTMPVWTFQLTGTDGVERTFLWDRLSHLLVTGRQAIPCVRSILRDTLTVAAADHTALFVLGDTPAALLPFLQAPQYTPLAGSENVWIGRALNEQIDALLAAHVVPDSDARPQLVVLMLPGQLTPKMVQAIMRLLARAHHRPLVVLLIAEDPGTALIPLTKILPILASAPSTSTLTIEQGLQHHCVLPSALDDHALIPYLTSLPQRKHAKVVRPAKDPWTFWQVEPMDLAPAIPGSESTPFVTVVSGDAEETPPPGTTDGPVEIETESQSTQSDGSQIQPERSLNGAQRRGDLQELHPGKPPARPPHQLDSGALRTIVTVALAEQRRQITASMVIDALSEYDIDEQRGWAILADVHEQTGVLLNRQGGRGAYRIDPKLKTEADVWALFNRRVLGNPLSDQGDAQDSGGDAPNDLYDDDPDGFYEGDEESRFEAELE